MKTPLRARGNGEEKPSRLARCDPSGVEDAAKHAAGELRGVDARVLEPHFVEADVKQAYAATDGCRVAIGRPPQPGPGGVVQSYEEALNTLDLADRMELDAPVLRAADLLVYPVLTRDRQAMADLVRSALGPLTSARGGPQPLLDTLTVYFNSGCVAAGAARRLSLSVRALTYRLERIHTLTGAYPADPDHRYMLQAAVIGARLLDWPAKDL